MKIQKGFNLMEITLVITLFLLLLGGVTTSLSSFYTHQQVNRHGTQFLQSLRRAQANAMNRYQNSAWGVNLDAATNQFTLFKGSAYGTRDIPFDEITSLPNNLRLQNITLGGGGSQIVFERTTGTTSNIGSFQIADRLSSSLLTIAINAYGQIEIQ